jgi:2-iminoacetate synthase ThiH
MHHDFQLDTAALAEQIEQARGQSENCDASALLDGVSSATPLAPQHLAQLWFSKLSTEVIYAAACAARRTSAMRLETFSPLYMTNTCDAECRMCGMRSDNQALERQTADIAAVIEQLRMLTRRGMRAVALLTGEYRRENRAWAMSYVNQALRATQELGFRHVLINVGSIEEDEFDTLLAGMPRDADGTITANLTMSTFQETYAPSVYAKFMGTDPQNPRADFERRLVNFDRAYRAGMRVANPGILLGLNPNLAYEMTALALHAQHLRNLGMEVYLSVPRLRRIAGSRGQRHVKDDQFIRLVSLLSLALPTCKTVVTTRENATIQQRLAPVVTVISAGSAAVTPYTPDGARFPLETSQFEVIDQRPFEAILQDHCNAGATIANFEPPQAAA